MNTEQRFKAISKCRICDNENLVKVYDLGFQALTGVFPRPGVEVLSAPLEIVKCTQNPSKATHDVCGLVQLKHTTELGLMYGDTYGYRTGLNKSMVRHVHEIAKKASSWADLQAGDLVIDIGANDSTLLQGYLEHRPTNLQTNLQPNLLLLGVDPSAKKFKEYYPPTIRAVPDFFSKKNVEAAIEVGCKAKIVTSISMFYDLEEPLKFMKEVFEILHDEGVWILEQSYLPAMMRSNSFDTICHEHLEYYELKQIKWMADKIGFKFLDVQFNDTNGGSFAVTLAKKTSKRHPACDSLVSKILADEDQAAYSSVVSFAKLKKSADEHIASLVHFLKDCKSKKLTVLGMGASTKGNVLLQYAGITPELLPAIAEVNENKFGCLTPATHIPIISEVEAASRKPYAYVVLPWHFKENLCNRQTEFLNNGGRLVFPLPHFHIVDKSH